MWCMSVCDVLPLVTKHSSRNPKIVLDLPPPPKHTQRLKTNTEPCQRWEQPASCYMKVNHLEKKDFWANVGEITSKQVHHVYI